MNIIKEHSGQEREYHFDILTQEEFAEKYFCELLQLQ